MDAAIFLIESQRNSLRNLEQLVEVFDQKPAEVKTKGYIQSVLEDIEGTFRQFKEDHAAILLSIAENSIREGDVPYLNEDIHFQFRDKFLIFKAKLIDLSSELQVPPSPTMINSTFRNDSFMSSARLPKIDLPKFSGDYMQWIPYRDMFLSLVDTNNMLTKVQKYFYLKGSCTDAPLDIVNQYPACESSYESAWKALNDRYHNTRKLVDQILHKFLSIPLTNGSALQVKNLLDTTRSCLSLLKVLDVNTSNWDPLLVHLISQKLDDQSRKEWERSLKASTAVPKLDDLFKFLETTFRTLECIEDSCSTANNASKQKSSNSKKTSSNTGVSKIFANAATSNSSNESYKSSLNASNKCPQCTQNHPLFKCVIFGSLSVQEKKQFLDKNSLCYNCLGRAHKTIDCKSSNRCRIANCNKPHHTSIHQAFAAGQTVHNTASSTASTTSTASPSQNQAPVSANLISTKDNSQTSAPSGAMIKQTAEPVSLDSKTSTNTLTTSQHVLLATVLVEIKTNVNTFTFKALVDQGAQASFITEEAAQQLGLPKIKTFSSIVGFGGINTATIKHYVELNLASRYKQRAVLSVNALVMSKLTAYKPTQLQKTDIPNLGNHFLADPTFYKPEKIDLVLGSDVYGKLLLSGHELLNGSILMQETIFGWMISGPICPNPVPKSIQANICTLQEQLKLFWEQEELNESKPSAPEDDACEQLFLTTVSRDDSGRYTVHLPFKKLLSDNQLPNFENTHFNALRRLNQIEASFRTRPRFALEYRNFMREYESLNHMVKIGVYPQDMLSNSFFLPHHGVLRENSSTTKLRVVFDGGNRTRDNTSLNSELYAGPALQSDLFGILLRWRRFAIAFKADIEKMFRQIVVCDEHQPFQCILWRDQDSNQICIYKLRTVTYGTTAAPYLAIRVLQQLANDEHSEFPQASEILRSDTYVDDVISGANTLDEAKKVQKELGNLLKAGGFTLRKWSTNSTELLQSIPIDLRETKESISFEQSNLVKALGMSWDTVSDTFSFQVNFPFAKEITKSSVLSDASKLFDPLGWIAPCTIIAKILFQKLWLTGIDWKDKLPIDVEKDWLQYRNSLKNLEQIRIPRWYQTDNTSSIELHAFSDASQAAYAAVIYIRVQKTDGSVVVSLVQSKTKVAPLKMVTIPKLELCAAALLAKLAAKVRENLRCDVKATVYWTDSTTVLGWIRGHASKWKVFIANRVAQIQRLSTINEWKYIASNENPADCASRGVQPSDLAQHNLWWTGPKWLSLPKPQWPKSSVQQFETDMELRVHIAEVLPSSPPAYPEISLRFSSFSKTIRILALVMRFAYNARSKKHEYDKQTDFLSTAELSRAHIFLILKTQQVCFNNEIRCLKENRELPLNSKIRKLRPFLDNNNVLRVGGRLKHANISFGAKHPILLSQINPLSILIFREAHTATLHGGQQLMQSYVIRRYWILGARYLSNQTYRNCITCYRFNAKAAQQLMGDLPRQRVTPSRAFKHSGVDYAGPITLKQSNNRRAALVKGYICVFVCMSTKAIHLEAVTDLTTSAFLAAFFRFISRRGHCSDLYSDCGTTFVGASKELGAHYTSTSRFAEKLAAHGTTWHFIPPAAPHHGGLWEAGVKSSKHHLKRVLGDRTLTYEELCTLLAQIESCLNSRPLCPLSNDPSECNVLTPAHFLVGEPTTCYDDTDVHDVEIDRLSRWRLVEKLKQHFWQRWAKEYVCNLQARNKWNTPQRNAQVDDIVLLLQERTSPAQWPLAKICATYPGSDGHVRVVDVLVNGKTYKRPITKICLLPINGEPDVSS